MRNTLWLACLALSSLILPGPPAARAQQEMVITIQTTLGDTTETFWLQLPRAYHPGVPCPLLIGWHQWGGNHLEMRQASRFDSVADARTWIVASHDGVGSTHWNNHPTQSHVVDVIRWIETHYSVDSSRIYMVGASMGGAAGMVFSNNHLDPSGPMVAAAASISGIQDCERRYHEQGINNSMIAAFGGTPEEVPFEYHRNSAIYFADSTASMHRNARHLPLLLTFGQGSSDQPWRAHAEDLYAVLSTFADSVVLHESSRAGHGWSCAEEGLICDFLSRFSLDQRPLRLSINADEEGVWYWADLRMRNPSASFARFEAAGEINLARLDVAMIANVRSCTLDLPSIAFPTDPGMFTCRWEIADGLGSTLTLLGISVQPALVLRDGETFADWSYNPLLRSLTLEGTGSAVYTFFLDPAGIPTSPRPGTAPVLAWSVPGGTIHLTSSPPGLLRWSLFDIQGRRETGTEETLTSPCRLRINLGREVPQGIHLLVVDLAGANPQRTVHKLSLIR